MPNFAAVPRSFLRIALTVCVLGCMGVPLASAQGGWPAPPPGRPIQIPKTLPYDYRLFDAKPANPFKVDTVGQEADPTLVSLTKSVETIDRQLAEQRAKGFSQAQMETLIEMRNLAVAEIDYGKQIRFGTSSTTFPAKQKKEAETLLDWIKSGLNASPGVTDVTTRIEYGGPSKKPIAILYQTSADSRNQPNQWSTYSNDLLLRVGGYIFVAQELVSKETCRETVYILHNPTQRKICGAFAP